jgi:hypothetical protein
MLWPFSHLLWKLCEETGNMSIIPCSVRHLRRSNEYEDNTPRLCTEYHWYILICKFMYHTWAHVHILVMWVRAVSTF